MGKLLLAIIFFVFSPWCILASAMVQIRDFKASAYFDSSYNYLQNSNIFTSGNFNRVFDINEQGFTLQQAGITLAYQPLLGFGGLLNVVGGRDIYIFAPYGWDPDNYHTFGFALPQAYLQYALGALTLKGGNLLELAGAEDIYSKDNTNFSRGILNGYAEPATVTGLRAIYIPNDKLSLFAGINNGWDNVRDTSRQKTIELGISYILNSIFSFAAYGYSGEQRIADRTASGPKGWRSLIDLIATLNLSKQLSFIVNYDYGLQTKAALPNGEAAKAVWQGVAGYANYKFNQQWHIAIRGEVFHDVNGYRTGVSQDLREATATVGYLPIKNLELRAETRRDFSNKNCIVKKNSTGLSNYQQSYALEAIYSF